MENNTLTKEKLLFITQACLFRNIIKKLDEELEASLKSLFEADPNHFFYYFIICKEKKLKPSIEGLKSIFEKDFKDFDYSNLIARFFSGIEDYKEGQYTRNRKFFEETVGAAKELFRPLRVT